MRAARITITFGLAFVLAGCAEYLIMAPEPRFGEEHAAPLASVAWGTASSPYPGVVAAPCEADQLAMVRVTRNFFQGLLATVTLGGYAPVTVRYFCALPPPPPGGEFDTAED